MSSFVTTKKALLIALKQPLQAAKTAFVKNTCTFVVKGDSVKVTGTNSSCTVETELSSTGFVGEFVASFDAFQLSKYIKTLGNGDIEIINNQNEDKITVKYGATQISFDSTCTADFLEPVGQEKKEVLVRGNVIEVVKNKLLRQMPKNDLRNYINGMYWDMSRGKLNLVTTNGHCMSVYTEDFAGFPDNQRIIPYEATIAISKLDSKRTTLFRFYDNVTVVYCGDTKIIAGPVEGKYPYYQKVLEQGVRYHVVVNSQEILTALKQIKIVMPKKTVGVKVEVANQEVKISHSETVLALPCTSNVSESAWFGVNVDYFINAIESVGTENVSFMLTDENLAIFVKSYQDAKDFVTVVMPMRL